MADSNETHACRRASTTRARAGRFSPPSRRRTSTPDPGPSPWKASFKRPIAWSWEEIRALPSSGFTGDIHCVTSWSKLGISITGVSVDTLLEAAMPLAAATPVLVYSHTGYTTNIPVPDVNGGRAWVVWEFDGQPLPREHGGPARMLVPHLYCWKSAKLIAGLRLLDHDEPGFWEIREHHNYADPWLDQRYDGD